MKKIYSHPLFYTVFLWLGLASMGLQFWFYSAPADGRGLLDPWHPATVLTLAVTVLAAGLALISRPHVVTPKHPVPVRALGALGAAVFSALASWKLWGHTNHLTALLTGLAAVGSLYVLWSRLHRKRIHYGVYALFALCFMFYLISRYRVWSAEPETVRYVFQLLALVCMMLVFYQKAALQARAGRFGSYHFWHSMAVYLSITALPSASNPALYLAAATWLVLDPSPRPKAAEAAS